MKKLLNKGNPEKRAEFVEKITGLLDELKFYFSVFFFLEVQFKSKHPLSRTEIPLEAFEFAFRGK